MAPEQLSPGYGYHIADNVKDRVSRKTEHFEARLVLVKPPLDIYHLRSKLNLLVSAILVDGHPGHDGYVIDFGIVPAAAEARKHHYAEQQRQQPRSFFHEPPALFPGSFRFILRAPMTAGRRYISHHGARIAVSLISCGRIDPTPSM
ncbi:hypothetical protein D3C73_801650 [compost metagenome]